jgi:imidazoleglycerol-phosphate dehydratase
MRKKPRKAKVDRKTTETEVSLELNIDGSGIVDVDTTLPFLDHMLTLMAYHGGYDLKLRARGDIEVDYHHLIEDIGICLGEAIKNALAEKTGIRRFGFAKIPMDESLAEVVIDLSGRAYLVYKIRKREGRLRDLPVSLFEDFFRSLSTHAMMNLHINVPYGRDLHHIYEAVFKAFGRALKEAVEVVSKEVPSTKGTI